MILCGHGSKMRMHRPYLRVNDVNACKMSKYNLFVCDQMTQDLILGIADSFKFTWMKYHKFSFGLLVRKNQTIK